MRDQKVTRREGGRIGIADVSADKMKVREAQASGIFTGQSELVFGTIDAQKHRLGMVEGER